MYTLYISYNIYKIYMFHIFLSCTLSNIEMSIFNLTSYIIIKKKRPIFDRAH